MPVTPLNYQIVSRASAPDDLPVTISEARSYVVLGDETDRDTVLRGLIVTARDWIEDVARTCLVDTVVSQKFQWFPCGQFARLPLCREPVRSITSITYVDADGATQTWSNTNYKLEAGLNPPSVMLKGGKEWPTISTTEPWPITVTYAAGPAVGSSCRGGFRDAVLLLLTYRHEFPTGLNRSGQDVSLPRAVMNLISPNMVRGFS